MSVDHCSEGSNAVDQLRGKDSADSTNNIADEEVHSYLVEFKVILLSVVE